MTVEDRQCIKDLFWKCLDAPRPERDEILLGSALPQEILDEVRRLLENHDQVSDDFPPPLWPARVSEKTVLQAGDLLAGRFRIERFLGAGGMGEVYQALDLSLPIPERVALHWDQSINVLQGVLGKSCACRARPAGISAARRRPRDGRCARNWRDR